MTARKRFYKDVTVTEDLGIALDGRQVKTPMKAPLRLPTRALAEAVAAEWAEQGDEIKPATMYLTKLANTAIDRVGAHRAAIAQEVLDYANSDLVCYRTDRPPQLVEYQAKAWDPVVDWARTDLDAPFEVTDGILHRPQPEAALAAFAVAVRPRPPGPPPMWTRTTRSSTGARMTRPATAAWPAMPNSWPAAASWCWQAPENRIPAKAGVTVRESALRLI